MQFNLINNYNAEQLFDLIFRYLKREFSYDLCSIKYSKYEDASYISFSCLGREVFCIELCKFKNNLIAHNCNDLTDITLLNAYNISDYFINTINPIVGKKFLIYLKCNLI